MMKLYTAIGNYKLNTHGLPTVVSGDHEYCLDPYELIIWTSLTFRILTHQELRAEFYRREQELHILGESEFEHYLNRLIVRRLIISGQDDTGVDALYDLIGHLYVQTVPDSLMSRTIAFFKLVFGHKLSFKKALQIFHLEKTEPSERQIMSFIRRQELSVAELILCLDKGKKTINSTKELMECLYQDEHTDCESIVTDGRLCEARYSVLSAVANLYMKQYITFHIL